MSSNFQVIRACYICGKEFTAKTTVTMYCSSQCRKMASTVTERTQKVNQSNFETLQVKLMPIEVLKAKEFLTVREVAKLLSCSIRTVYNSIQNGTIKATNMGQRLTRVKRSELNKLFTENKETESTKPVQLNHNECYSIKEVQKKYGISESTVYQIIKRNHIPKLKDGWFTYVPKTLIDQALAT